ncbi:MAG: hypothetical protein COB66_08905 [Coxiella sp. (in: Bacteria)]|nr:MAG: hypothetical protein COB66_08905 [Coxiella sp. (in: g-proteobacteria)]
MKEDNEKNGNPILSFSQSIVAGGIAGGTASLVNRPSWTISTRLQQGLPLSFRPSILYKGTSTIIATTLPLTALQLAATSAIERTMGGADTISSEKRMLTAFLGGATPGIVSNSITLTIVQQHKHNTVSFIKSAKSFIRQRGFLKLTTGLPATMLSDGLFIFSFYGLAPTLKKHIQKIGPDNIPADAVSGTLAGWLAAVTTHIPVRIKTFQQNAADIPGKTPNLISTVKSIAAEGGVANFFKGLTPRLFGLPLTITAASMAMQRYDKYVEGPVSPTPNHVKRISI